MSWMLSRFPLVPTLRIKPVKTISKLGYSLNLRHMPGRSTKEISLYSGPVISKQTMLGENESSVGALKSTLAFKNVSAGKLGLRIANWARSTRPFTASLSVMSSPKGSLDRSDEFAPPEVERRKKTRHIHVSPRIKRHSIGHLRRSEISPCSEDKWQGKDAYLVHASPGAFGSGTPEVAWMRDDFPELCEPRTAMIGRSMSWSSLLVAG